MTLMLHVMTKITYTTEFLNQILFKIPITKMTHLKNQHIFFRKFLYHHQITATYPIYFCSRYENLINYPRIPLKSYSFMSHLSLDSKITFKVSSYQMISPHKTRFSTFTCVLQNLFSIFIDDATNLISLN